MTPAGLLTMFIGRETQMPACRRVSSSRLRATETSNHCWAIGSFGTKSKIMESGSSAEHNAAEHGSWERR